MPRLSENAISFFGAGGHKHDGVSSTLISTDKYSLFDFNPGYRGSQSRITIQQANQAALEEWVMNLVNTKYTKWEFKSQRLNVIITVA
jgi:hypothetical protein